MQAFAGAGYQVIESTSMARKWLSGDGAYPNHGLQLRARNEAERFFRRGLGYCRAGDFAAAERTWRTLIAAFGDVEAAGPAVRSAKAGLALIGDPAEVTDLRDTDPALAPALERIAELRDRGADEAADRIADALRALYRDAPPPVVEELDRLLNPPDR